MHFGVSCFETKSYHVTQTGLKGMAAASAQLPKSQSYRHKISVMTDTEKNKAGWRCFGVGGIYKTSSIQNYLSSSGKSGFTEPRESRLP